MNKSELRSIIREVLKEQFEPGTRKIINATYKNLYEKIKQVANLKNIDPEQLKKELENQLPDTFGFWRWMKDPYSLEYKEYTEGLLNEKRKPPCDCVHPPAFGKYILGVCVSPTKNGLSFTINL